MAVKIVVVDDHALMLQGVVRSLEAAGGFEVVGTGKSGSEVMSLVKETEPDVALLDIQMPGLDGLRCLELIKGSYPDVRVVMFSGFDDPDHVERALAAGASAYIVKSIDPVDLPSAVRQVCNGTVFHAFSSAAARARSEREDHGLTERERTILMTVARGLSNKAIAAELWVTEQTVKFHLNNIYRKLAVENRAGAIRFAYEHGLVEQPVPQSA